ncbi:MAG: TlpA family protein disulfide reductase [Ferrimicrobium sp.]
MSSARMRRFSRQRISVITGGAALAVVVAVFVVVAASTKPAIDQVTPSPLLYHRAPMLAGPKLYGRGQLSLGAERGSFVLVNYFASWCASCATEEAQLARLGRSHDGVVVFGVDYDDSASSARSFLARYHVTFPVIQDPQGANSLRWGVSAPPESFLIAPNGVVLAKIVGPTTVSIVLALVHIAQQKGY